MPGSIAEGVRESPEGGLKIPSSSVEGWSFGPFFFDPAVGVLSREGRPLALPPRAQGVLAALLGRAGQLVPKHVLLDEVWKDTHVTDTSLAEAVSLLRQALGDDPQRGEFIQTVPRRGYRFVADVTRSAPTAPSHLTSPPGFAAATARGDAPLWTPWLPWLVALSLAVVGVATAWNLGSRGSEWRETIARFDVPLPSGFAVADGSGSLAIAPDSSAIAIVAVRSGDRPVLLVRDLAGTTVRQVQGADGADSPFFSPDGRALGYFADGWLWRVDLAGGEPRRLAEAPSPAGGAWGDGAIVYAPRWGQGLMSIAEHGGQPRPVTHANLAGGEGRHAWPSIDRSSQLLTYAALAGPGQAAQASLRVRSQLSARMATVVPGASWGRMLPSGHVVAWRDGHAVAAKIDALTLAADPQTTTLPLAAHWTPDGQPLAAISSRGAIVRLPASPNAMSWVDAAGRRVSGPLPPRRIPIVLREDGVTLLASSNQDGRYRLIDLARGTERIVTGAIGGRTADGAVASVGARTGLDIHVFRGGARVDGVETADDEAAPAMSPDGRFLAWQSNASGAWQIATRALGAESPPHVVAAGTSPAWSRDGRILWYLRGDTLMASAIDPGSGVSQPGRAVATGVAKILGVTADGRVLVVDRQRPAAAVEVVLGWAEQVRALLEREPRLPRSFR